MHEIVFYWLIARIFVSISLCPVTFVICSAVKWPYLTPLPFLDFLKYKKMRIFKFLSAFAAYVASTGVSTHVLDLTTGLPGPGMKIDVFYQIDQGYGVGPDWTPIRTL